MQFRNDTYHLYGEIYFVGQKRGQDIKETDIDVDLLTDETNKIK